MQRRHFLLHSTAAFLAAPVFAGRAAEEAPAEVDVLLVLAADVSRSMDEEEARLQREGYAAALEDPRVLEAVRGGPMGSIAIAYVEWSGTEHQRLLLPWTRLDGAADAARIAGHLRREPLQLGTWTALSAAIDYSVRLLSLAPFQSDRRVVDISGDGMNNAGPPAHEARDRAVAEGIIINGLPVMKPGSPFGMGTDSMQGLPLDSYYRESVMGGAGAFVLPAEDFVTFGQAVRRKLVLEIAESGRQRLG